MPDRSEAAIGRSRGSLVAVILPIFSGDVVTLSDFCYRSLVRTLEGGQMGSTNSSLKHVRAMRSTRA